MAPRRALTARAVACLAAAGCVLGAGYLAVGIGRPAAAASGTDRTVTLSPTGSMRVHWRGNGHGHGMSQYGARGAAIAGLSMDRILAFYYPHTALSTVPAATIRVLLSGAGRYTTVWSGTSGLAVSGFGALPRSGYSRFRLAPKGSGLQLQGRAPTKWRQLAGNLPARSYFRSNAGFVRVAEADGTSTSYRGQVGAVRRGSGESTINRAALDSYVAGVVPREMPASWRAAAVHAQAVAARSYASSEMAAHRGDSYDICDTTSCQVYGGMAHYDRGGHVLYTDDLAAIAHNRGRVLTYRGAPIFAQYSASDGGATVAGGAPYLPGKVDRYDAAASGDPYLTQSRTVPVSDLASYYGLRRVTSVRITARDGNGAWGGRVQTAYVDGVTAAGRTAHVATTGSALGAALGVWTDFLQFEAVQTVPGPPRSLRVTPGDAGASIAWRAPADTGHAAITGYRVRFGAHTLTRPASARSAWVGSLPNGVATAVSVRAVNAFGRGRAGSVRAQPSARPGFLRPVRTLRLFDSRHFGRPVDHAHPFRFDVAGAGTLPRSGLRSVQLAVSILHPTASGVLRVYPAGVSAPAVAAIAYTAGQLSAATASVPLSPSSTLVFRPSAGQVALLADQESYTAASGPRLHSLARHLIGTVPRVPTGAGKVLSLDRMRGIGRGTRGVLLSVSATTSGKPTWLRIWQAAAPLPAVRHVSVGPGRTGTTTLLVPVGSKHRIRIGAGAPGVSARVVLRGVLGAGGWGRLESFPADPIADDVTRSHPAVSVGTRVVTRPLRGVGQIRGRRVRAALLLITVRPHGRAGSLRVWPAGARRPVAPSVTFGRTGTVTATVLVGVNANGKLSLRGSAPALHVSVDAVGYITSG